MISESVPGGCGLGALRQGVGNRAVAGDPPPLERRGPETRTAIGSLSGLRCPIGPKPAPPSHLGVSEEEGEEGKANCLCWSWCSESTRSGIPGEVPTVSFKTSSGSRM